MSNSQPSESFDELLRESGGVLRDPTANRPDDLVAAARPLVTHFADPAAEQAAARESAVVFDVSDRTQIELRGGDRTKFLHGFCTNDVKKLAPGRGCEAFVTNVKGRVIGHAFVFAGDSAIWLDGVPGQEPSLLAHLDKYLITEDVQIVGRTADCGELFVSGPESAAHLASLGIAVAGFEPLQHGPAETLADGAWVRRVDLLGTIGFLVSVPRDAVPSLWRTLTGGGFRPAGAIAFQSLRIAAGMPWFGVDVTEDNLAQEVARTSQAISFTKGCYLGQEPIARIDALGHVNRELRRLEVASGPCPLRGDAIHAATDDAPIGAVTSAAVSPESGLPVALGYLKRGHLDAGRAVIVKTVGGSVPARVASAS